MIAHIESLDSIRGNPPGSRSLLVSQIGLECSMLASSSWLERTAA
jgi:hypothetical protein